MASSLPLPDGSYITAREGETPADTWARAQQMYPEAFAPAQQAAPQPAAPKKESIAADLGYSALGGIGNLVAFPGQAYGLATGDMDNQLSKAGKSITDYAQSQQSEGFKARQAKQQAAIAEASKEGFLSEAGTAITSTLKDPVLLGNFIAENIPNLIPGFGISRGTMGVGMRMAAKEIAAQGLEGEARNLALDAAQSALAKKATALAVGASTAQQGADVGAQAYEDIYKKLITQKVPPEQAADKALSLARAAGLSGAAISYLSSRLPGARALEQSFAGAKGVKAAGTGAIKGLLGEGASEAVEEGGGAFARNVAMSTVDPTQNLMQGVGTAVGQGALLGGVLGGVAGMRNSSQEAAAQSQADIVNKQREAYDRVIAARQADADKVARLQDPAYLDDLLARSQAINTRAQKLTEAAKGDPKDDVKLDPLARAEKENARRAKAEFLKSDEYKDFRAEMGVAAPFLRQRQKELAPARDAARAAALSPEQEARYAQQPGSQWTSKQTGGRGKGALGVTSKEELAAVRIAREIAEETKKQAPILAQQKPLQEYATQQLEHPRSLLLNDTGTFVSYLMEDPAKARSIVQTRTPIPDMTPQQNREVHAALGAAISLRDKQQQKTDKAEATAEYAQRTQDLQGQLPQKPTTTEKRMGQTVESLQQSMADDENVRTTGEYNLDYIVPMLEKGFPGGKAPVIAAPATVTQTRTADTELAAIDALQAEFAQANKNEQTAKLANEAGAAEAARSRRQTAADELNKLTGGSPYTREVVRQRFEQQTALDEMQNNAERIRQGQYLGYKFGTGETKAAGLVADLRAQIAAREAAKEITDNVGELQRINAELTRLNVQLNTAQTDATRAADRDQSDLAATTQPLLWKKAEAARDAYVKSTLEEAATHRAARGVNGVTQDEALKAASEMHDLLDLRIDRRDGERNKHINKRLAEIKQQLNHPERARTRVAAEPLTTQYAPVEAKKTAEEKGETATTLAGELRRRSDYVGNLVEKALGREMPADVRTALETAQKAIEDKRVTRDLLNAVETQAERVLTGRLKGIKTKYSQDVTKRDWRRRRGVAETNLQEDPRYVQDINDALLAMETTPETQGELFAPADNTASITKREQEITAIDAEIAEEQALHDRLEKAAINNRTDIRPAAERMVGIKADIDAKRQQQDIIRKEIARLKQEETDKGAVAKQIEGLGTPAQEAQVFETEGGFTPDDQAAAFGTPPPMATAVLGFIRNSMKAFVNSPLVRNAKARAQRLRRDTEQAEKRQKYYEAISAPRMQAIADIQKELDETLALLTGHEWIATAYPQLRNRLGGYRIEDALGPILEKDIRDATMARVGTARLKQKAAKARADIAKERQQINELLAKESAGDADVIAAKARAVGVRRAQSAVDEQRGVLRNAMDNAREQALTRIRAVRAAFYAPVLARLEGQISGLTVQLETARTAIRDRLSKQGPLNVLGAAAKEGGFEPYVEKLFKEETAGIYSALAEAKKAAEDIGTRQNEAIESDVVNVAAVGDRLVKFEFARLETLQKDLDKLTANKAASPEVVAATEALAQQRGIAEQARQAANDSSDAVYKAKNERLSREATLSNDARVTPLQRQLVARKTAAKKITGKRGFAKLSPVEQAKAVVGINAQIAAVQAQIRKVTGETLSSAYTTTARNTSVTARQKRLEEMIASPKSSAQRVRRAQQALAVLEQRTRQMGRVIGPVSRDATPVTSTFNVGDTAAQTEAKTTTAPTGGQRKKYLDQKRAPVESKKSVAETTATLRLQNATETWNNARALAGIEGLSRADKKAAEEAADEAMWAFDNAQAALEVEQARGKKAEPAAKTSTAKDTRRNAKGARGEDFELGSEEDRVRDAKGARDDDVELSRGIVENPHTVASLVDELQKQTGKDVRGRVGVFKNVAALLAAHPEYEGRIPTDAKGFVDGKYAFLIAENIEKGAGLSVLLHEVGTHIGMKQMFNPALYKSLVAAINKWAAKKDGSLETRIMQAAQQRVDDANTPAYQREDELLAYAVEEALNAGVMPTALSSKGVVGQWLSRVLNAMQKVLMRFGINVRRLSAQQLVDMSYGAAGIELSNQSVRYGGAKLFAYAGKNSATADHPSLVVAQDMLRRNTHPKDVFEKTGWFIGQDGKWRYEIDDSKAKLTLPLKIAQIKKSNFFDSATAAADQKIETTLGAVFEHPDLFKAYPELQKLKITLFNDNVPRLGYTSSAGIGVNISSDIPNFPNADADIMTTLLHEVQHILQRKEGFTGGSSPATMFGRVWELPLTEKLLGYYQRIGNAVAVTGIKKYIDVIRQPYTEYARASRAYEEQDAKTDSASAQFDANSAAFANAISKQEEKIASADTPTERRALKFKLLDMYAAHRVEQDALGISELYKQNGALRKKQYEAREAVMAASESFEIIARASNASDFEKSITLFVADQLYTNKYGEIEARDTTLRRTLNAEARRTTQPYSSQDISSEEIVFSRGRSAFENRTQETRGTAQQLFEARGSLGLAFRQATADMRASLREILQRGDSVTGMQAQASLLSADSFVGNSMAVAEQGAFTLSKDSKGYIKMEAGGSKSLVDVLQMASKIPLKNADDRIAKFQGYVTALRGEQVGYDMLDFKDPKGAEVDGRALLAEVRANPEMLKALQTTHEVYRDLNKGMIQFLKDTYAISADLANKLLADKNYIPFYREKGGSLEMVLPTGHPQSIGDIRSLPFLQALKGGDDKLMSFPDAAIKNIAILTNLGVQNMANRQIAYHLSAIGRTSAKPTMQVRRRDGGSSNNLLRWKQQPDPAIPNDTGDRHIVLDTEGTAAEDIPTDLLTQAVAGSYATFPWLLEAAGTASNLLRTGVTRNPAYLIGQLIKDPFGASMTGNLKASPLRAIVQVIGNFGQIISGTSLEEAALRKAGVVHSNVFSGGKGDLNKVALQIAGNQQGFIKRGLAGLDKLAMSADAATRTQAYKDAIASGASEVEAIVSARELANYNRHGSEASVQFLSKAIPFFNASIQGLDATLRSAQGKMPASQLYAAKQKFFNRAMGLAGMTVAYSLMMDDDEEWRKLSLRDKISYIHIPRIFGQQEPMRLPAPFETGMLFYSMPMAFMEALKGEFTAADLKVVRDVFLAQLPGSGSIMPQFAKGLYDVTRNYNSGTGRPIVPASLEGKDPAYQFTAQTTEAAKRMAEMLQATGVKLSAIQLEFLSNSYLGGLPLGIAQMTNQAFAKESKAGVERPAGRASDTPIVGRFFQSERGTDDIDHVYEFANKAKMANDTFNMLKKQGDIEETRAYLLAHRPEIAMAPFAAQFSKVMGTLKQMDTLIDNAPKMSAEVKQQRKDATQKQREQIAKSFREALKRAPAPA